MTQGQLVSRVANSYKKTKIMKHKTYLMLVGWLVEQMVSWTDIH